VNTQVTVTTTDDIGTPPWSGYAIATVVGLIVAGGIFGIIVRMGRRTKPPPELYNPNLPDEPQLSG